MITVTMIIFTTVVPTSEEISKDNVVTFYARDAYMHYFRPISFSSHYFKFT
jgi:hypothetical protein